MRKYNLLLVEDDAFLCQTLKYELKKVENINLIGTAEDGKQAVEYVKTNSPDIILMDINMPVMNGIDASREIKKFNNDIIIVILSSHNQKDKVIDAFKAGASAYCVKEIKIKELLNIFNIVSEGGIWVDTQIAGYIFEVLKNIEESKTEANECKSSSDYKITTRERNILKLVADGLSNEEIANELVISKNTVKNHIASIINKLSVKDRTQAAIFAIKNIF